MGGHRVRYIPGMGHQVLDPKGKVLSTHDEQDEAETARDTLNDKASKGKEANQDNWKKK